MSQACVHTLTVFKLDKRKPLTKINLLLTLIDAEEAMVNVVLPSKTRHLMPDPDLH